MALDVRNLARLLKGLRPNPHVRRTRNIRVPMDDGVTLETEHFAPVSPGPHPTVLTRVPYGIVGFSGMAEYYAEHGFNVVLQACRGTARSERRVRAADQRARRRARDACAGSASSPGSTAGSAVSGPSYVGYATWAIADAPEIKALSAKVDRGRFPTRSSFPAAASTSGCG